MMEGTQTNIANGHCRKLRPHQIRPQSPIHERALHWPASQDVHAEYEMFSGIRNIQAPDWPPKRNTSGRGRGARRLLEAVTTAPPSTLFTPHLRCICSYQI